MKKKLILLLVMIFLNVLISFLTNADMLSLQEEYLQVKEAVSQLEKENSKLAREVAHLSSLSRINQEATEMNLISGRDNIVFVAKDQFAKL